MNAPASHEPFGAPICAWIISERACACGSRGREGGGVRFVGGLGRLLSASSALANVLPPPTDAPGLRCFRVGPKATAGGERPA